MLDLSRLWSNPAGVEVRRPEPGRPGEPAGSLPGNRLIWGQVATWAANDEIIWGTIDEIIWGTNDEIIWGTTIRDPSDDEIIWGTSVTTDHLGHAR